MLLKLKGWIYRRIGIYLAHKEELEYIKSERYQRYFKIYTSKKDNDMSESDIQELLIGM